MGGAGHEEIRAQVRRIAASRFFARSRRLCRFLHFSVEQTLAGDASCVKEQLVGIEVFDRKPDYDPRVDPIVRVEARRLRSKLKQYYDAAGPSDAVRIEFPVGSYAPRFFPFGAGSPAAHKASGETSIAILPFANLTPADLAPEGPDDYFSDGLTEELIRLLTRVEGLRIVSWHSAVQLRGREQDLEAVRRELGAGNVLRGSVRRTADRVRVSVYLIETSAGAYLWSEVYDRSLRDLFAIQEEIARSIVDRLRLALAAPRRDASGGHRPNLACYNLCLQGRFHANRRTKEGLEKSVACYDQAIAADPSCAFAHAGLADAYSLLADYSVVRPSEVMPPAREAALRALKLDPNSAEANVSLAFIRSLFDWEWADAETLYRRAIAANPGYARARHWYGLDFLTLRGRFDEAREQLECARSLDPLSQIVREGLGTMAMMRRDFEPALRAFEELMELDPTFYKGYAASGRVLSLMGRYDEAVAMFENARRIAGGLPNIVAALGQTLGLAGRRDAAFACLRQLQDPATDNASSPLRLAMVNIGLGETCAALDHMERACELRELGVPWFGVHPVYDPVRGEPRFQAILRRVGL
ncbi:MAG TPA: tetratricopeptide repeat protein [Bryobacteraceae bacterium]|nr:tetratricopeptide repeat protein [Bryobacteraceae bacterium]